MKEIRLGTIGSGMIVHAILDCAKQVEGIRLVAAYSRDRAKGEELAEFVKQKARTAVNEVSGKMSDEDRNVMYKALDVISKNLEIISKDGIPEK